MATSGSFDTTHRINGSYNTYGHFEWSQASQSIADNQTKINFTFSGRTAGPNQWVYTYNAKCTVDGSSYGPWSGNMYNGTTMVSGSKTITHSADGTKSFSASGSLAMVESNNTKSGSGSWTLNTIPRQANITSAPDFNDEANPTIYYENKAGNSVTSLQACISLTGSADDIAYRDIPKTGTSYTFNLTTAERNVLRNATTTSNSRNVTFFVKTVIGSNTFYSTSTKTFSIVNANPTFTNFTYADTNSTTTNITGNNQYIIQNKSSLRATISSANKAVANKGASMSNYTFAISSYSGSANYSTGDINKDIGTINATTNQTLTITAKDSRGNTKAVSKTVSIVPYSTPSVVASVTRANNFEATTTISVRGAMSLLKVNGVTKNAVDSTSGVQYRYKDTSTSTWGSWTNIASTTAADGSISTSSFILTLDNTKSFNFEFKITDRLETKTLAYTLAQGQPQFFIGSDGRVAVGGTPSYSLDTGDTGLLDVKGKIYARDLYKNNIPVPNVDYGLTGSEYRGAVGWGNNFDSLHTIAATYRVFEGTSPFNETWWGTLMCVGDKYYMQQFAICNWTTGVPAATKVAVRTWVSNNGDNNGYWTAWAYLDTQAPAQNWQYLGKAVSTASTSANNRICYIDIPSAYQNCSLMVDFKGELSAAGGFQIRAQNSSGTDKKYTITSQFCNGSTTGTSRYTDRTNFANIQGEAYSCMMMTAKSVKVSSSGNYRIWAVQGANGTNVKTQSSLQSSNEAVQRIAAYVESGTAQSGCILQVWGIQT